MNKTEEKLDSKKSTYFNSPAGLKTYTNIWQCDSGDSKDTELREVRDWKESKEEQYGSDSSHMSAWGY